MAVADGNASRIESCRGAPSALRESYDECHERAESLASLDA